MNLQDALTNDVGLSVRPRTTGSGKPVIEYTKASARAVVSGLMFLALSVTSTAQTFNKHQIGESVQDFLKLEPKVEALRIDCENSAPRELSDAEVQKRFGKKALEELRKRRAANDDASGHVALLDKDQDVYGDRCGAVLELSSKGHGTVSGWGYDPLNPYLENLHRRALAGEYVQSIVPVQPDGYASEFSFQDGHLYDMKLSIYWSDYQAVRDDVSDRLGTQPLETSVPYHNAYGATWNNPFAVWDTASLHVELLEIENPAKTSKPHLWVQTQEAHQRLLLQQKQKPKPLGPPF